MDGLDEAGVAQLLLEACTHGRTDIIKQLVERYPSTDVSKPVGGGSVRRRRRQSSSRSSRSGRSDSGDDGSGDDGSGSESGSDRSRSSSRSSRSGSSNSGSDGDGDGEGDGEGGSEDEDENGAAGPRTLLQVASAAGQLDAVRALLKLGATVDARAVAVATPDVLRAFQQELLQHVASGNAVAASALVADGALTLDFGDGSDANDSALHWAASFGQRRDMFELLLSAGAHLERRNAHGRTALHEACASGHVETARALLDLGCDATATDDAGRNVLDVATKDERKRAALVELLAPFGVAAREEVGGLALAEGKKDEKHKNNKNKKNKKDKDAKKEIKEKKKKKRKGEKKQDSEKAEEAEMPRPAQARVEAEMVAEQEDEVEQGATEEREEERDEERDEEEERGEAGAEAGAEAKADAKAKAHAETDRECQPAAPRDSDEVAELRRMNEEKDLTIVALRETIETVLKQEGVLTYISRLQEGHRDLAAQLQRAEDHKEHLQSVYVRCDAELERSLRDNAMLRSALHDKEQRLLTLLEDTDVHADAGAGAGAGVGAGAGAGVGAGAGAADEAACGGDVKAASALARTEPLRNGLGNGHGDGRAGGRGSATKSKALALERSESIDVILLERDRLAKELEGERRLRFSEARLHLAYTGQLRDALNAAQQVLKKRLLPSGPDGGPGPGLRAAVGQASASANANANGGGIGHATESGSKDLAGPEARLERLELESGGSSNIFKTLFLSIFGAADDDDDYDDDDDTSSDGEM